MPQNRRTITMQPNSPFRGRLIAAAVSGVVMLLAASSAIAQSRPSSDADRRAPAKVAEPQGEGLTAELMYRLLVGDIAFERGDPALAARAYFEAAKEGRDVRLPRRATELALAARQKALSVEAARLWATVDPSAERP